MPEIIIEKDYAGNILQNLWLQCQREKYCDLVIIVGAEEIRIPVHRSVLAAASQYFINMLEENPSKEIKISRCAKNFRRLIEYIYTGRVEIHEDNVEQLLEMANELLLKNVVTACANFLLKKLNSSNCITFMSLAEKCGCENLFQKSKQYSLQHFMEISKTVEQQLYNLRIDQLSELLANDDLVVSDEEDVFNCIKLWIQHDPTEREQYKADLLKLLRMSLLDKSFLLNNVKKFCTSPKSVHVYLEALESQVLPDGKTITPRNNSNQFLIATTLDDEVKRMHIHYYCPKKNKWMKLLKNLEYRYNYAFAVLEDNLYIVGGRSYGGKCKKSVNCFNFKTMTESELAPMAEERLFCQAAILKGSLYVVGGVYLKSVEKWNRMTKTWSKVAPMSVERYNFGIAVLNEKLYVVGGHPSCNTAEYYDPRQNIWTSIATMNEDRIRPGMAVANGIIYLMGSLNGSTTAEKYDPETHKWILVRSLNERLCGLQSCTTFRNKVVVCYKDRIEEYNADTNKWISRVSSNTIDEIYSVFTYSGEIRISAFAENN